MTKVWLSIFVALRSTGHFVMSERNESKAGNTGSPKADSDEINTFLEKQNGGFAAVGRINRWLVVAGRGTARKETRGAPWRFRGSSSSGDGSRGWRGSRGRTG